MRWPLGIIVTVLLAGCALGPNYRKPQLAEPAQWKTDVSVAGPVRKVDLWWQVFGDATLNQLMQKAVAQNLDLKSAMARTLEARAIARLSGSEFFPSVKGNPSASWGQPSQKLIEHITTPRDWIGHFKAPLDLSYEIDVWGRVRRTFESSRDQAIASFENERLIWLTLTADVATNYYLLRSLQRESEILGQGISVRQEALQVNVSKFQAGLTSKVDVSRAEIELANTEVDLAESQRKQAQLINALAVLVGENPSQFALTIAGLEGSPPSVPPGLPSDMLKRRPDVSQAEAELAAKNAEVGVAFTNFFPVFRLTGTAGFESADLASFFTGPARTFSFGPSVSIPIFEGGRHVANYKAAKARYEQALAQYHKNILVAFRDVEDALVDLKQRDVQIKSIARAVAAANQSLELANLRYRQGVTNYIEVVDVERSLLAAELRANEIHVQQYLATIRLVKALGGGW